MRLNSRDSRAALPIWPITLAPSDRSTAEDADLLPNCPVGLLLFLDFRSDIAVAPHRRTRKPSRSLRWLPFLARPCSVLHNHCASNRPAGLTLLCQMTAPEPDRLVDHLLATAEG